MSPLEEAVREELQIRRRRILANPASARESELVELLRRVDCALERLDRGDWGRCLVCEGDINPRRMVADPMASVCLECLSELNRRALERDLTAASRVQAALLPPSDLRHGDWEVAMLWEPHGPVSGDYCDLIRSEREEGPVQVVLGDVAGKGLAASLIQTHLHALIRALALPEISLGKLLGRANGLLNQATLPEAYATLVAGRLFPGGRVELANGGHPPPLLADARGVRPVEGGGLPLGLFREAGYDHRELFLKPGDTLFLYTDGLTEAATQQGEYGVSRAAASLRRHADLPLRELLSACRKDLRSFLKGAYSGDDLTLVAIRRME